MQQKNKQTNEKRSMKKKEPKKGELLREGELERKKISWFEDAQKVHVCGILHSQVLG